MAMVTSVMRAHQVLLARVHAVLTPFELTFAQYEALMLLQFSRTGQLPLGKIGQRLQVHPASVTNVIDRLEGKGFVERRPHPDDQRTTLATITRSGRAVASRATAALNEQVFQQTGLSEGSLKSLVDVVTDLRRATGDFHQSTGR
jgi:DNA-binding MarR family transcriptional regulator